MVNCLNLAYLVIFQLFKIISIFLSIGKKESTLGGRLFPAKFGGLYSLYAFDSSLYIYMPSLSFSYGPYCLTKAESYLGWIYSVCILRLFKPWVLSRTRVYGWISNVMLVGHLLRLGTSPIHYYKLKILN